MRKLLDGLHNNEPRRRRVLPLIGWHLSATIRGIMRYAREAGWTLDLRALRTGVLPDPVGVDGILCLLGGLDSRPELTDYVRRAGLPTVDLHGDESDTVPAGRVLLDNVRCGELAAEHLAGRGITRCVFCCRSLADWSAGLRAQGFRRVLDERGIGCRVIEKKRRYRPGATSGDMLPLLVSELAKERLPVGIFAENDDLALVVLEACAQSGIQIPEQAVVVGCDNDPLGAEFASVPLSSIDPNLEDRSYRAAQLLDRMMSGEPAPDEPIMIEPLGVVARQSTDILAVTDLRVATALTFIRRNIADSGLTTGVVADGCDTPPRTLTRLFKQHLDRTVADEISRLRLERACQSLLEPRVTLTQVAATCGFAGLLHMRRNFLRHLGTTPRKWRKARIKAETPARRP